MRAYIPPNFDDDGGFFWGLVKKRNAVEAGVYLGILYILFKIFINIFSPLFVISVFLILGFAGSFFLLAGFDGRRTVLSYIDRFAAGMRKNDTSAGYCPLSE